jgi:hypothetical protein
MAPGMAPRGGFAHEVLWSAEVRDQRGQEHDPHCVTVTTTSVAAGLRVGSTAALGMVAEPFACGAGARRRSRLARYSGGNAPVRSKGTVMMFSNPADSSSATARLKQGSHK